jgi:hypothetical protein
MVLPQFHVGVRSFAIFRDRRERSAIALGGKRAGGGEVGADADHVLTFDLGFLQRLGHGLLNDVQVIERIL